jgi:hypothetical protein
MKPRLTNNPPMVDPKLVTEQKRHGGEESNPNIANTVSRHNVVGNVGVDPNHVVSEPHAGGGSEN